MICSGDSDVKLLGKRFLNEQFHHRDLGCAETKRPILDTSLRVPVLFTLRSWSIGWGNNGLGRNASYEARLKGHGPCCNLLVSDGESA